MNVLRYDLITETEEQQNLFTVPVGKAYTVVGFTIVETEGESGEITIGISDGTQIEGEEGEEILKTHIIGQFGISGNDTIYPISNVNMVAGESLIITCSTPGIYVTASIVSREV